MGEEQKCAKREVTEGAENTAKETEKKKEELVCGRNRRRKS